MATQGQLPGALSEGSTTGLEPSHQSLGLPQGKDKDLSFSLPRRVAHPVLAGSLEVRSL